jgi:hypothetical protein
MEISNATAAGPSYGILDVLFGSKPEESGEAAGQEVMPFMNLINALKEQSSDKENSSSWTDEETASGRSAVEYSAVGIPGMFPPNGGTMDQLVNVGASKEGVSLDMLLAKRAEIPKLETIDPKMVNGMLEASSLLPLTKEEQKLLTEVNKKIEEQNSVISKLSADKVLGEVVVENSEAASAMMDPEQAQFLEELKNRGVNPEGLRGMDLKEQGVALEKLGKFLSTESYLQMHEKFIKPSAKAAIENGNRENDSATPISLVRESKLESSLPSGSGNENGKEFLGNTEKNLLAELKPNRSIGKQEQGLNFAAGLMDALKASDFEMKEIQLPANPTEAKSILTGEVNQNVNLQALKGGGEMRLIIYPEQMGEVKLHVGTNNGKVEVKITAENEEVAKVIRSGSKDLEVSLRDQNLSLTKFDVSVNDSAVSSLDNKGNLTDQFLQQQNSQQSFMNFSGRDDGNASKWHGNGPQRENSGGFVAKENENSGNFHSSSSSKNSSRMKDRSRKLDVVA